MSKGRGKKIAIKFDKALLGDVTGNQGAFTVSGLEKNPLFYGEPKLTEYEVDSVARYPITTLYEDDFTGALDGVEVGENGVVLSGDPFAWGWENHGAFATATQAADRTYGWVFTAQDNIAVTKLRLYPNVSREIKVDLWDSVTQTAIASANIDATAHQWNEITLETPVGLISGRQYRISIDYTGGESAVARSHSSIQQSEFNPQIQYVSGAFANAKNTYPASNSTTYAYGIADIGIGGIYGELGTYTTTTPADTLPENPRLKWTEDLPAGTSITAEYAVNLDALTPPAAWTAVSNAGLLTIPDPAMGYFLWLKLTLATTDTAVTPTLLSVWLEEAEAPPDTIILTMAETGRFNDTEGDLTVAYDQALGNLAGTRPVASFEESFTPTDLEPTPVHEHTITVRGEPVVNFIPVYYHEYPDYAAHTIAATAGPINIAFIHVDDIPP